MKSKEKQKADSGSKQKKSLAVYHPFGDTHKWKILDFLKDFVGNVIGMYIFLISLLLLFFMRGRNSRLEDHLHYDFGEAPV